MNSANLLLLWHHQVLHCDHLHFYPVLRELLKWMCRRMCVHIHAHEHKHICVYLQFSSSGRSPENQILFGFFEWLFMSGLVCMCVPLFMSIVLDVFFTPVKSVRFIPSTWQGLGFQLCVWEWRSRRSLSCVIKHLQSVNTRLLNFFLFLRRYYINPKVKKLFTSTTSLRTCPSLYRLGLMPTMLVM